MTAPLVSTLMVGGILDALVHNWALISIVATLIFLVFIPMLVLRKYVLLIINIFDDTPPPLAVDHRDYERLEGEKVQFRAFDGHYLQGMILEGNPRKTRPGLIIFAHEYGSNAYSWARYCRPLLESGFTVFTFDFRGHGDSSHEDKYKPRQWPSDREQSDMLGAIAFAENYLEEHDQPKRIGLFGISRGGGSAILSAVGIESVKAILTDGAFSSDTTLEYLMKRWVSIFAKVRFVYENHPPAFWRFLRWLTFRECHRRFHCRYPSVRKAIVRLGPTPMFFVHGERDSYIPVEQSEFLYNLATGPKFFWIVPRAKHNMCVTTCPEEYRDRTVRFFNQFLAGQASDTDPLDSKALTPMTQKIEKPRPNGSKQKPAQKAGTSKDRGWV